MALQNANPVVVARVERLARTTGLSKTAVAKPVIDRLASELAQQADPARMQTLFAQLDQIPPRTDACDPLEWNVQGLPSQVGESP
jgi:antitoxin VapB